MKKKLSSFLICVHWLTVIFIVLAYFTIETRGLFGKESQYHNLMMIGHFYTGFYILFITVFRLIIKPFTKLPSVQPNIENKLQQNISKVIHCFLYFFLIVMPLLGWLILSAAGAKIPCMLPPLLSKNNELLHYFLEIHEFIGNLGMFVILFHTLGALYNHFKLKNNVLKRMFFKS